MKAALHSIINLVSDEKTVLLYLPAANKTLVIKSLNELFEEFPADPKKEFTSLETGEMQLGISAEGEVGF